VSSQNTLKGQVLAVFAYPGLLEENGPSKSICYSSSSPVLNFSCLIFDYLSPYYQTDKTHFFALIFAG
jgi:hypothetical protein